MADLESLRRRVERVRARRDNAAERLDVLRADAVAAMEDAADHTAALPVVIGIAQAYRKTSFENIETLISKALTAVLGYNFGFELRQSMKRNQVETLPLVVDRDGHATRPMDNLGGGVVDVVSVTARAVLWGQQSDRSDPVITLDEPAHMLNTPAAVRRVSEVLHGLSRALGIQFIVVTNRPGLASAADRIFRLSNPEGSDTEIEQISSFESAYGQS